MSTFIIQRYNPHHHKWENAFGLNQKSYIRNATQENAILEFKKRCCRCRTNLLLVRLADFGSGQWIVSQTKPPFDYDELAQSLANGTHTALMRAVGRRNAHITGNNDDPQQIKQVLFESFYPEEIQSLVEATSPKVDAEVN